jgi:hypothetical protein
VNPRPSRNTPATDPRSRAHPGWLNLLQAPNATSHRDGEAQARRAYRRTRAPVPAVPAAVERLRAGLDALPWARRPYTAAFAPQRGQNFAFSGS